MKVQEAEQPHRPQRRAIAWVPDPMKRKRIGWRNGKTIEYIGFCCFLYTFFRAGQRSCTILRRVPDPSEDRENRAFRPTLVIYAAFDLEASEPLITAFQDTFPAVAVTYHDLDSNDLYERFLEQVDSGNSDSPDLLISSAMDLTLVMSPAWTGIIGLS